MIQKRAAWVLVPLLSLLAACSGDGGKTESAPEPVAQAGAAIRGGDVEMGEPAVGMLEFMTGRFGTATLIAPNVVITAGHVVGGSIKAFYTGLGIPTGDYLGTVSSDSMVKHDITEKLVHPSYQSAGKNPDYPGLDLDMGLVRLATPITDIAPRKLGTMPPKVGKECKMVGFGRHEDPTDPMSATLFLVKQKRSAVASVEVIQKDLIRVGWVTGIADSGDSGGPLFCDDILVGETCCHTDGEWPAHKTEFYTRTDITLKWISDTMVFWGNPPIEGSGGAGGGGGAGGSGGAGAGGSCGAGGSAATGTSAVTSSGSGATQPPDQSGGCSLGAAPGSGGAGGLAVVALGLLLARKRAWRGAVSGNR